MANVASIPVKHQQGNIPTPAGLGASDQNRIQRLSVRRGYLEVFVVGDAKLVGLGDVCAGIDRDIARIDKLTARGQLFKEFLGSGSLRMSLLLKV